MRVLDNPSARMRNSYLLKREYLSSKATSGLAHEAGFPLTQCQLSYPFLF